MEWTEEVIERLRQLWDEGHSTAEIGRRLGTTKNAVVGKAHRLKLPTRPSPIKSRQAKKESANAAAQSAQSELFKDKEEKSSKSSKGKNLSASSQDGKPEEKTSKRKTAKESAAEKKEQISAGSLDDSVKSAASSSKAKTEKAAESFEAVPPVSAGGKEQKTLSPKSHLSSDEKKTKKSGKAAGDDLDDLDDLLADDFQEEERPETKRKKGRKELKKTPSSLTPQLPKRVGLTCQWPFGDPGDADFHFCGKKTVPSKPYCLEHCEQAYVRKNVR